MCQKLNRAIFAQFVSRSTAQGYKGKARDKAALEFVLGACAALTASGQTKEADHLELVAALLIATRGYSELATLASKPYAETIEEPDAIEEHEARTAHEGRTEPLLDAGASPSDYGRVD